MPWVVPARGTNFKPNFVVAAYGHLRLQQLELPAMDRLRALAGAQNSSSLGGAGPDGVSAAALSQISRWLLNWRGRLT